MDNQTTTDPLLLLKCKVCAADIDIKLGLDTFTYDYDKEGEPVNSGWECISCLRKRYFKEKNIIDSFLRSREVSKEKGTKKILVEYEGETPCSVSILNSDFSLTLYSFELKDASETSPINRFLTTLKEVDAIVNKNQRSYG